MVWQETDGHGGVCTSFLPCPKDSLIAENCKMACLALTLTSNSTKPLVGVRGASAFLLLLKQPSDTKFVLSMMTHVSCRRDEHEGVCTSLSLHLGIFNSCG